MSTWKRLSSAPNASATFLVITMITSWVDSLSVNRPTTFAKGVRLVIGLVILMTVPMGAVRCKTSFLFASRPGSSIQVATPFSFFSNKPNRLAFKWRSRLSLLTIATDMESRLATGFGVLGFIAGWVCAGAPPDWIINTWPGCRLVDVKLLSLVRTSTVVLNRLLIPYNVSPAETLY